MDYKRSEFPRLLWLYRKRCLDGEGNSVSQEKVSEELGYAFSTYGQWERGLRSPKTRQDLINVVNIFRRYGGIKNREEADKLLTTLSFAALQAKKIKWV